MTKESTAGHRQRLRERFMRGDPTLQGDEALLELLLTFAIPQKDVQPLAKDLIHRFGNLPAVLQAPPERLSEVPGIKEASSVLLKVVGAIKSTRRTPSPPAATQRVAEQSTLFDSLPASRKAGAVPAPSTKAPRRRGTGLFGKSAIRDAVALLPKMSPDDSPDDTALFLKTNLPYNSAQTRERNSQYFRSQMFSEAHADRALIQFARTFPDGQELKEVCLYRFCSSEPIVDDFVEHLLTSKGIAGNIGRDFVLEYLQKRFPGAAAADDCATAIVSGFEAAGVFRRKGKLILYAPRNIPLPSLAFILHSEFPDPGMYDIGRMEKNRRIRALLWKTEQFLPSLYELRNGGLISKISEIDNVRQFTTKWTLPQLVERLAGGTKPS